MVEELEKNKCITCECPNCNCEVKEKLPAGKFHIFMSPEDYKVYAVCNLGLQRLSHEYGFWDKLNGPIVSNQ